MFNFLGVMVSSGAIAFSVLSLLPVERSLQVGGSAGSLPMAAAPAGGRRVVQHQGRGEHTSARNSVWKQRLNFTRDNYRMMRERMLSIRYWKQEHNPDGRPPTNKEASEAAKNVVMMDLALFNAEPGKRHVQEARR